jgi:hypothetical protein
MNTKDHAVSGKVSTFRALDLALEALEQYINVVTSVNDPDSWGTVVDGGKPARDAITAIKQARSAPYVASPRVQEPDHGNELTIAYMSGLHDGKQKREWVGLTDEEIATISKETHFESKPVTAFARAIEAKLKEKNT